MIKADEQIARMCNREMREECERILYPQKIGEPYAGLDHNRLSHALYNALPESQKNGIVYSLPTLPKKWHDCEWGLFYRGLVFDPRNPFFSGSPLTGKFTPDNDQLRNGVYCPLLPNGEFDLWHGCVDIYVDEERDVERACHHDDLLEGLVHLFKGLFDVLSEKYTWILRCDEDLILVVDKKPKQCEVEGHGLCYMAELKSKTNTYFAYWDVLDDENAATICDWQHPFKVVKECGLHEVLAEQRRIDDEKLRAMLSPNGGDLKIDAHMHLEDEEIALSDTVFAYLIGEDCQEYDVERAVRVRQWFV